MLCGLGVAGVAAGSSKACAPAAKIPRPAVTKALTRTVLIVTLFRSCIIARLPLFVVQVVDLRVGPIAIQASPLCDSARAVPVAQPLGLHRRPPR